MTQVPGHTPEAAASDPQAADPGQPTTREPTQPEPPMSIFASVLLILTCALWLGITLSFAVISSDSPYFEQKQAMLWTLVPIMALAGVGGMVLAVFEIIRRLNWKA